MLKKEFEERTKLSVSEAEFNGINALYMACGEDIDKDEFCKLYMTFDGRLDLMHKIEREHQLLKMLFTKKSCCIRRLWRLSVTLLMQCWRFRKVCLIMKRKVPVVVQELLSSLTLRHFGSLAEARPSSVRRKWESNLMRRI